MEAHQVVPEILDVSPKHTATVKYGSGGEMNLGQELTPLQVKDAPTEVTWPTEPNALYTVLFTDPDAPSRELPLFREILHWLVINVPGGDLSKGTTITEYIGAGPPDGSGLHRYVLTIYKQPGTLSAGSFTALQGQQGRWKFNTREFVAKHNLGQPIAGNYFQAQTDDFVRKQQAARLAEALKGQEVVGTAAWSILDSPPENPAFAFYSSNVFMHFGNELTPTQVKDIPTKIAWKTEPNALYTVILTDALGKGKESDYREILHWMVLNVKGTDISKGDHHVEYIGSGPPKEVGINRYVLLVFKQPQALTLKSKKIDNKTFDGRAQFSSRAFAKEHGLQLVAANFYVAQYDDYVPILHRQLGREYTPPN